MKKKAYAVSDLHGNLPLWRTIVKWISNNKLFVLGDAGDRGFDGYKIIREALEAENITYLKGNHDDMFVEALLYNDNSMREHWLTYCGGKPTAKAWIEDGAPDSVLKKLNDAPIRLEYVNTHGDTVILSHAGYTPEVVPNEYDLLWGRDHFGDTWPEHLENCYIIHGHTPTHAMHYGVGSPLGEACFYAGNHKINIDCGTARSDKTVLLDLDTFNEIRFELFPKEGRVDITRVEHRHYSRYTDNRNTDTAKSIDNYLATDRAGYDYAYGYVGRRDMFDLEIDMFHDGMTIILPDDPCALIGRYIVGNMRNPVLGANGQISITSKVRSVELGFNGEVFAYTNSGSIYCLRNPL